MVYPQSKSNLEEDAVTPTFTSPSNAGQSFQQVAIRERPSEETSGSDSNLTFYQLYSNPGLPYPVQMDSTAPFRLSDLALQRLIRQSQPPPVTQNSVFGTSGQQLQGSDAIGMSSGNEIINALSSVTGAVIASFDTQGIAPYASVSPSMSISSSSCPTKISQQTATTQDNGDSTGTYRDPDTEAKGEPVALSDSINVPLNPGSVGDPDPFAGNRASCTQSEEYPPLTPEVRKYLDLFQSKFGNQPRMCQAFSDLILDSALNRMEIPQVICRVAELFVGHPDLIVGFNKFLPSDYKVEVEMSNQLPERSLRHGIDYNVTISHITEYNEPSTALTQHTEPGVPVTSSSSQLNPSIQSLTPETPGADEVVTSLAHPVATSDILPASPSSPYPVGPPALSSAENNLMAISAASSSPMSPFGQKELSTLPRLPENNVAIMYVNRIKKRFKSEPNKYKQFLDILYTYQKEQRTKEMGSRRLTELAVYNQVAVLFENQDDLLQEFLQYMPGGAMHPTMTSFTVPVHAAGYSEEKNPNMKDIEGSKIRSKKRGPRILQTPAAASARSKPATKWAATKTPSAPPPKKSTKCTPVKGISLAKDRKYAIADDFAFFEQVRVHLRSKEVYQSFVQTLRLFNLEILSKSEALQLLSPLLVGAPQLLEGFRRFLGSNEEEVPQKREPTLSESEHDDDELPEEHVLEIDFSTCKPLGASYRALPKDYMAMAPISSGQTMLCKEVLNDEYLSCPALLEDSTLEASRKKNRDPLQDVVNRCEDQRYELDMVIEANAYTIVCLEAVMKTMAEMTLEELQDFELDDCLGGTSSTIHLNAVRKIYGHGSMATDIIEGLKTRPFQSVPIVLNRLRLKDVEWKNARRYFNQEWEDKIEYFKASIDEK